MKSKLYNSLLAILTISIIGLSSCNDDDDPRPVFGVAFETTALGINEGSDEVDVVLSFTTPTIVETTITLSLDENGVAYGADYETDPISTDGELILTVPQGVDSAYFTVSRVADFIGSGNSVSFAISSVDGEEDAVISGNTTVEVSFEAITSVGGSMDVNIGGPTEPNQVFVDLSLNSQTAVERTSWDLGFYTGGENRVILNYGTYMAAKAIDKTDLNDVTAEDTVGMSGSVGVGTFDPASAGYIDSPDGDLSTTAIAEVSVTDSENKVYIINLGGGPGTSDPEVGGTDVTGTPRGWKKVRFLLSGEDYIVQHADINATTFSEATVSRDELYHFVYFSIEENSAVSVAPPKNQWDIEFNISSEIIPGFGAYGYSDFLKIARLNGVEAVLINSEDDEDPGTEEITYEDFTVEDAATLEFSSDANVFGSSWRDVFSGTASENIYFVIKDPEGNHYKMQVQSITNDEGVRGHTEFVYELL